MNKLVIALSILIALTPRLLWAAELADCDVGTAQCACPPIVSLDDLAVDETTFTTTNDCFTACYNLKNTSTYSEITSYNLQCNVGGTLTSILQGELTLTDLILDAAYAPPSLGVEIPGLIFEDGTKSGNLIQSNYIAQYVSAVYAWLISAGALVAIIMIMIGGLQYTLAHGEKSKIDTGKKRITNALTGMLLLMFAYTIAFLIDPNTVQFETLSLSYIEQVNTENTGIDITTLNLTDPQPTYGSGSTTPVSGSGTNGVPYFSQRDYADVPYGVTCDGGPTIKSSGCGPTSASMVLRYYGVQTDPIGTAASFEAGGYRICGSGTSYAAFTSASVVKDNGLIGENISIADHTGITAHLQANEPIIISVGPSRFTSSGHFIVLTGVNTDGTFSINDPNSGITFADPSEIWGIIKFAGYIHR